MARHRYHRGLTLSRARHRAPSPAQRAVEHGLRGLLVSVAAAFLVMSILGSDPGATSRT